jgi:hypothetical protein
MREPLSKLLVCLDLSLGVRNACAARAGKSLQISYDPARTISHEPLVGLDRICSLQSWPAFLSVASKRPSKWRPRFLSHFVGGVS